MLPKILLTLLGNPLGLVAAASPFIISHIQAEKARLDAQAAHRSAEMKEATKIASEVFTGMDTLAYLSKQAMFSIVFRGHNMDDIKEVWKTYQEAMMKWESSRATISAQIEMYFGEDNAERLAKIKDDFETLAKQVDAAFFKRKTSQWFIEDKEGTANDFRTKYFPVWDGLMVEITEISKEIIRRIQYEEVGSLRRKNSNDALWF